MLKNQDVLKTGVKEPIIDPNLLSIVYLPSFLLYTHTFCSLFILWENADLLMLQMMLQHFCFSILRKEKEHHNVYAYFERQTGK